MVVVLKRLDPSCGRMTVDTSDRTHTHTHTHTHTQDCQLSIVHSTTRVLVTSTHTSGQHKRHDKLTYTQHSSYRLLLSHITDSCSHCTPASHRHTVTLYSITPSHTSDSPSHHTHTHIRQAPPTWVVVRVWYYEHLQGLVFKVTH